MTDHITPERRQVLWGDRRQMPRGGRRTTDQPGRHPRLLVVASYDAVGRACGRYLEHFGFHVERASRVDEAMAVIGSFQPSLIVSDLVLPAVSAAPIVYLVDDPDQRVPARVAGAVLAKPFAMSAMLRAIRRLLRAAAAS